MGSLLATGWLAGVAGEIRIVDEASVSLVREEVRRVGAAQGLPGEAVEQLVTAASELAHNQRKHARFGAVGVRAVRRLGVAGVEVIAADQGGGIGDPAAAFRDRARESGPGLGIGLSSAYRLADELDVDVRRGEGTCVWARKFAAPVPRQEIAVLARPIAGEAVSGDHAAWVRLGDMLVLGVVDGLGHGTLARDAAEAAVATLRADAEDPPLDILDACDHALERTRGAVMTVVRFDAAARALEHVGSGNVTARLYRQGTGATFLNAARVLGTRRPPARVPVERVTMGGEATLLVFSDGLSTRAEMSGTGPDARQPPIVQAQQMMERFGRADDDALVLVARLR